jgi:TPR repeat protein
MNNIIEFPERRSLRMVKALNAFEAMDNSQLLADEFRLLAEIGLAEANFYLGCMYENGNNGLPEDIPLALEQYELAARKIGLLDAYMAQARLFYHGKGGIEKDLCKAKNIYEQIKDYNQNPIACFMLGRIYHMGKKLKKISVKLKVYIRWQLNKVTYMAC